jgi:hypothetical protein
MVCSKLADGAMIRWGGRLEGLGGGKCYSSGMIPKRKKRKWLLHCGNCVASFCPAVYILVVSRSHVDFGRLIIACSDGNRDGRRSSSFWFAFALGRIITL